MGEAVSQPGSKRARIFIRSAALTLASGFIVAAYQIAGITNMSVAHLLIAIAWIVSVFSIVLTESSDSTIRKKRVLVVAVTVLFVGLDFLMVRMRTEQDMADAQPKFSVDSEPNPMSIIYENKVWRRKINKRARVMVKSAGKKSVDNVKVFVTKVNDIDCRNQLPVSSLDTAFERPNPSPVDGAVTLNPGEEQYFDALVECIAPTCPNGELAVPHVENGRRLFGICYKKDAVLRPKTLTIRVSGNVGDPTTKTFVVSELGRELLLQPQSGGTENQGSHNQ